MPPKKGGKKEKEIEEARLKAEEEARLQEIRNRREKELRDQREKEELEKLFKQEAYRLLDEEADIARLDESKQAELRVINESRTHETEWKQLTECSTLPNPKLESEINTYLFLLADDSIIGENGPTLKLLVQQIPDADNLSRHLEEHAAIAMDQQDDQEYLRLKIHLEKLRNIINDKWDYLTADILQHIDYFSREPNENFQLTSSVSGYSLAIWGNVTKNPRFKMIEFAEQKMSASLPKPLALSNVAIRMLFQSGTSSSVLFEDTISTSASSSSSSSSSNNSYKALMSVVGGVLYLDLAEFPELPKTVDTWTIRQILSPSGGLKRLAYPFKKLVTDQADDDETNADAAITWPTLVTYHIPPETFLNPSIATVRYYNDETKSWEDDNITDVEIDQELGQIKFRTIHFKPTALVQPTYCELPFHDWSIEHTGVDRALVKIQGKFNEIHIEIVNGDCQLVKPMNSYISSEMKGKMSPSLFLKKMSIIGLNFRGPKSLKGFQLDDYLVKNPLTEEICILGISLCAAGFDFRRNSNNRLLASSKVAFQFRERGETADDAWSSVIFDANFKANDEVYRAGFIVKSEVKDNTQFDLSGESTIHSSVYHLLKPSLKNADNIASVENSSALFTRALSQIIRATRLLCFS